jgi:hypothetical protein
MSIHAPQDEPRCTDTTCVGGHPEDHAFYVTVRDAGRTGFLLGPYDTHPEALTNVDRGRKLAIAANDRAWFYAYGTASVTRAEIIKTVFGDTAPASEATEELTITSLACDT